MVGGAAPWPSSVPELVELQGAVAREAEAVLRADPNGKYARQTLFRAGECSYLAGKSEAAAVDLTRFCQQYREDALAAYANCYLGELSLESGDLAAAKSFYAAAFGWGFTDYGPTYAGFEGAGLDGDGA